MTGFTNYNCSCGGRVYEEWWEDGLAVTCSSCNNPFPKDLLIQKGDVYPSEGYQEIGKEG